MKLPFKESSSSLNLRMSPETPPPTQTAPQPPLAVLDSTDALYQAPIYRIVVPSHTPPLLEEEIRDQKKVKDNLKDMPGDQVSNENWVVIPPIDKSTNDRTQPPPMVPPEPLSFSIDLFPLQDVVDQVPQHDPQPQYLSIDLRPLHKPSPAVPDTPPHTESVAIDLYAEDDT